MNGQEIAAQLGKRRGTKPTTGTIYPALKGIHVKGLVTVERKGRTTTYTLTASGNESLERACRYIFNAFGDIFQAYGA